MKISRIINGNIEEITLSAEELSEAYYEKEHLFDIEDCRQYVEEKHLCSYGGNSLKGSLLDYYFNQKGYETFIDDMAYAVRNGIDKIGLIDLDMPTLMEEVFWDTFERMNKLEMPDKSVSVKDMFDFGYDLGGMLPISTKKVALELSDKMKVYALHNDRSESLLENKEEFEDVSMFGIHKTDWEKFLQEKKNKSKTYSPDLSVILRDGKVFCFHFLRRLDTDCYYFLNYGNADEKVLWTGDINSQVDLMEDIFNAMSSEREFREFFSLEEIRAYRGKMLEALKNKVN